MADGSGTPAPPTPDTPDTPPPSDGGYPADAKVTMVKAAFRGRPGGPGQRIGGVQVPWPHPYRVINQWDGDPIPDANTAAAVVPKQMALTAGSPDYGQMAVILPGRPKPLAFTSLEDASDRGDYEARVDHNWQVFVAYMAANSPQPLSMTKDEWAKAWKKTAQAGRKARVPGY